jgi:hypothetical protein
VLHGSRRLTPPATACSLRDRSHPQGRLAVFWHEAANSNDCRITFNAHILETGTQSYRLATSKTSSRKRAR